MPRPGGAQLTFNTEYLSHTQDDDGVTCVLRDRLDGRKYTVRSRFLVGADGARPRIVEELGLPVQGQMGRAGTIYTSFRAELSQYVAGATTSPDRNPTSAPRPSSPGSAK